jgi:hypothetical protein
MIRYKKSRPIGPIVGVVFLAGVLLVTGAVWTNTFGAGDRFDGLMTRVRLIVAPPPDRPIQATVDVTDPPPTPTAAPDLTAAPGETLSPTPTPGPTPVRKAVDFKLRTNPKTMFASEATDVFCAPAGVQIVLAIDGKKDNSVAFQREIAGRIGEWESRRDSRNGGWGPAAIAQALAAYGVPGYQIRAYEGRDQALRDSAAAIRSMNAPVLIMAWRGAHTWVMTGYTADADPTVFPDANVTGAYIYDPWYPLISSIWGPSDPPGTLQNLDEMRRNFLQWQRPEGNYPDRDGKYIVVVPTIPIPKS